MQDADITPWHRAFKDLRPPVFEIRTETNIVCTAREGGQIGFSDQNIIRINHPEIVGNGMLACQLQRFAAVGPEVPPRALEDVTANAACVEELGDDTLRTVL